MLLYRRKVIGIAESPKVGSPSIALSLTIVSNSERGGELAINTLISLMILARFSIRRLRRTSILVGPNSASDPNWIQY